jgi:hypothetical protein
MLIRDVQGPPGSHVGPKIKKIERFVEALIKLDRASFEHDVTLHKEGMKGAWSIVYAMMGPKLSKGWEPFKETKSDTTTGVGRKISSRRKTFTYQFLLEDKTVYKSCERPMAAVIYQQPCQMGSITPYRASKKIYMGGKPIFPCEKVTKCSRFYDQRYAMGICLGRSSCEPVKTATVAPLPSKSIIPVVFKSCEKDSAELSSDKVITENMPELQVTDKGVTFEFEFERSKPNELGVEFKFSSSDDEVLEKAVDNSPKEVKSAEGDNWRKSTVDAIFEAFLTRREIPETVELPDFPETPAEDKRDAQAACMSELAACATDKEFEAYILQARWRHRESRHLQWVREMTARGYDPEKLTRVFSPNDIAPRGAGTYFMCDGVTPVPK